MRPATLAEAVERVQAGSPRDIVLAEFVDTFDLAKTDDEKFASIEQEPKLTGDARLDALVGPWPNTWRSSDVSAAFLAGFAIRPAGSMRPGSRPPRRLPPCANI
jgi:hypothetical protein